MDSKSEDLVMHFFCCQISPSIKTNALWNVMLINRVPVSPQIAVRLEGSHTHRKGKVVIIIQNSIPGGTKWFSFSVGSGPRYSLFLWVAACQADPQTVNGTIL